MDLSQRLQELVLTFNQSMRFGDIDGCYDSSKQIVSLIQREEIDTDSNNVYFSNFGVCALFMASERYELALSRAKSLSEKYHIEDSLIMNFRSPLELLTAEEHYENGQSARERVDENIRLIAEAEMYFDEALVYAEEAVSASINDFKFFNKAKNNLVNAQTIKGKFYFDMGNFQRAEQLLFEANSYFFGVVAFSDNESDQKKFGELFLSTSYKLGVIYMRLFQPDLARDCFVDCMEYAQKLHDQDYIEKADRGIDISNVRSN
jgi:tetratricopeptide (TPR) repeat protein